MMYYTKVTLKMKQVVKPAPKIIDKNKKHKRKRNIIWFNLPYLKNAKPNIRKTFLQILPKAIS